MTALLEESGGAHLHRTYAPASRQDGPSLPPHHEPTSADRHPSATRAGGLASPVAASPSLAYSWRTLEEDLK